MSQEIHNPVRISAPADSTQVVKATESTTPLSTLTTPEQTPNPEAVIRSGRRRFTADYKLKMLKEIDQCSSVDESGAILRREGLYSSQICEWRKARTAGALSALSKKRGRHVKKSPQEVQIEQLKKETERLRSKLDEAEAIIDIQKKVSEILGNKIQRD